MFLPTALLMVAATVSTSANPVRQVVNVHCQIPEIDFQEPAHTQKKQVAFTFDDGPDGERGETDLLLDQLKKLRLRATFFVCGDNWAHVATDAASQKTIRRIVAEGHELGNHTSHHYHLPSLTPAEVFNEFKTTQDVVLSAAVMHGAHKPLTLLRAPYGQPFEADAVNTSWVAPVVAQLGVHIGWNINSYDWACKDKTCVVENVVRALDAGQEGAILMHSNYRATTEAMPILAKILEERGFAVVTVEQLLLDKFGATSEVLHKRYLEKCVSSPLGAGKPQG